MGKSLCLYRIVQTGMCNSYILTADMKVKVVIGDYEITFKYFLMKLFIFLEQNPFKLTSNFSL